MKHLGDITKINGAKIEPVDVITFGSPCQDLSVAGKRAGLAGERSGLFVEAVRIIKEMRSATNGVYPTFAIWENVPGAFSSNKGEDFRAVLEELVRIVEPDTAIPQPPKGKWSKSGTVMGDGWSLTWKILDAQFWGVPQRRRRISLAMDFRAQSAPEILFIGDGLQRDSAESGKARKRIARDIKNSTGRTGTGERNCLTPWDVQSRRIYTPDGTWPSLYGGEGGGRGYVAESTVAYGICSYASNSMKSDNPHSGVYIADTSRTLDLNGGNPACNQGGIAICEATICLNDQGGSVMEVSNDVTGTLRAQEHGHQPIVAVYDARGNGDGLTVPTMTGGHQSCITDYTAILCYFRQRSVGFAYELAPTVLSSRQDAAVCEATICLKDQDGSQDKCIIDNQSTIYGQFAFAGYKEGCSTLRAEGGDNGGGSENLVVSRNFVRRLTPLECERLQGYPDLWTVLPEITDMSDATYSFWCQLLFEQAVREEKARLNEKTDVYEVWRYVKPKVDEDTEDEPVGYWENTGKPYSQKTKQQMIKWYNKSFADPNGTDSVRYKALGNSIALPPWKWVLKRISAQFERDATLGSLFDGIGGFPLIWEQLNGKGSARWASEIEPFPIAVTKYHFGEE